MRIEHIALWTNNLERCKQFYVSYFGASASQCYVNVVKGFERQSSCSERCRAGRFGGSCEGLDHKREEHEAFRAESPA